MVFRRHCLSFSGMVANEKVGKMGLKMRVSDTCLRVAVITHDNYADEWIVDDIDGVCLQKFPDEDRLISEMMEQSEYKNFDLYLIHPEYTDDIDCGQIPGYALLFSGAYEDEPKWVIPEKAAKVGKEFVKRHWRLIVVSMRNHRDFKMAVEAASEESRDRHRWANRRGPSILTLLAREEGIISKEFSEALVSRLKDLADRYESPPRPRDALVPIIRELPAGGELFPDGRVLLVDDEHRRGWSTLFGGILGLPVYDVQSHGDIKDGPGLFAIEKVGESQHPEDIEHSWNLLGLDAGAVSGVLDFDLVLADYRLKDEDPRHHDPELVTGTHLIRRLHSLDPSLPVIVVTASESYKTHRELSQYHIIGYYVKPHKTRDDKYELRNFLNMVEYVREHAFIRDLWELAVWLDQEQPGVSKVFLDPDILNKIQLSGEVDPETTIRSRVSESLMPALIFMFREQRNVMAANSKIPGDPERISPLDVLVWCIFRISHASDWLIGKFEVHGPLDDKLKSEDPVSLYASCICRALRNLVAHGAPPFLTFHDLILQVLCIYRVILDDAVPDSKIERLYRHYENYGEPDESALRNSFRDECSKSEIQAIDKDGFEKFVDNQWERGRTTQQILHCCYICLFRAVSGSAEVKSKWGRLVLNIIAQVLPCSDLPDKRVIAE